MDATQPAKFGAGADISRPRAHGRDLAGAGAAQLMMPLSPCSWTRLQTLHTVSDAAPLVPAHMDATSTVQV